METLKKFKIGECALDRRTNRIITILAIFAKESRMDYEVAWSGMAFFVPAEALEPSAPEPL